MTWFKLDDKSAFHRKVLRAGNEAWGALCRAGCASSSEGTDGRITLDTALAIAPMKVWEKLIASGLVERTEGSSDLQIHDFLDWNPSAEQVRQKRDARARAGAEGGRRSGQTRSKSEAIASAVASTERSDCFTVALHTGEPPSRTRPVPRSIREEPPVGPPGARPIASTTETPVAAKMVPASGTPSQVQAGARETGRETPAKTIGDRKRPATRMPPEPEVDAWLAKLSIPPRASSVESAKFVDYHLARGSVMADWAAAWRTWTRNSVEFAQRAPARGRSLGGIQPQSTLWRPKAVNDPEDPLPDAKPGELAL